jgi:hypothetical protein
LPIPHYQLSSLGNALTALAAKMEPQPAAEIAKGLATALENPQETDSDQLSRLGKSFGHVLQVITQTLVVPAYWRFPICCFSHCLKRLLKAKGNLTIGSS